MYSVILNQSPELAARQALADSHHSPYTSQLPQYKPGKPCAVVHAPWMDRIIVESVAYKQALDIVPSNATQRRKLAAVLACGPTYESCRFFHPKGE